MKRRLLLLLPMLVVLVLAGCASDDDPFPVHSSAAAESGNPVAGVTTSPKGDSSAGWKW